MNSTTVTKEAVRQVFVTKDSGALITLVIRSESSAVLISKKPHALIARPEAPCFHIDHSTGASVILAGQRGPAGVGIPGPAGGSAFQRTAGETLSALRVVYELDGTVHPLDYRDDDHIDLLLGITLTAADTGELLNVQRSGPLDDSSWNWTPGRIWLGADGALTQIYPVDGYDVLIGSAVSATRILLNLQDPIDLE